MSTIATKERPILFSGPMVKAILDGRKTQTRRIVKHHLYKSPGDVRATTHGPEVYGAGGVWLSLACPHGQPGERLWVKETLRGTTDTKIHNDEKMPFAAYSADGTHLWTKNKYRQPWRWKRSVLPLTRKAQPHERSERGGESGGTLASLQGASVVSKHRTALHGVSGVSG